MTDPELDMDWCLNDEAFEQGTTVQNNVVSTTPTDEQENDRLVSRCQLDNTAQSGTTRTTKSKLTTSPAFRESIQHMINDFLARERQKCINDDNEPFIDGILRPEIQHGLAELGNKFLATLFLKIGGPQQIVALRRIACNERAENTDHSSLFEGGLSTGGRLRLIFALDEKVAGSQLSRWYHILELFKSCGGCDAPSSSGNLNTTPATFGGPGQSRGNPIHREDSRVAKDMVHECFPEIPVNSSEYSSKLRRMKQIRKLGKRLHLLVRIFGEGILGLMFDLETRNDTMATADSRLLDPTEDTFKGFVDLLNYSQGDILRETSKSVWPLLLALLRGF
ncbi:hypothetical protein N8T08_009658 [Aspergillus melleus]|uniref:Uncharacterized protein n=1 Tax=Aspergillus melleus TaxID=138277 RepID=A0ACC3ATV8_9EURO|nr:hypothetical protein N8T08_009658 [Aspergillus melleus]